MDILVNPVFNHISNILYRRRLFTIIAMVSLVALSALIVSTSGGPKNVFFI